MAKQKSKKSHLTPEEIRIQLFDGLMLQIEPDLAIKNRTKTAKKFAKLTKEERKEWMTHYERAFALFFENWPRYIEAVTQDVDKVSSALHEEISMKEQGVLHHLEEQMNSSDDAA